jgi:hypothetical protein
LTQDDIIQLLREKKAKKELERSHKEKLEKVNRVIEIQSDMMTASNRKKPEVKQP